MQQPLLPERRRAARALPRHERRRLPRRGGRAPRDRGRLLDLIGAQVAVRAPARRRLRARPAARRGPLARLRDGRARALALGRRAMPARRWASTCASTPDRGLRRLARRLRRRRARRRDRAPRRPGRRGRPLRRPAAPRRRAVRRHARPVLGDRAHRRRRWWGFVPAHTRACCRARTLRELLAARGLVISADVPLVRSFSGRRWVVGPGRAPRARRRAGRARWPTRCPPTPR